MGELSAEQIWQWSQVAEANAPIWSRQAWGAWRLGNSLDVKNQEMSETGRFGFDAADAKGHLGAALGEAVTKLRAHMSGYAANTGELQAAMERVAEARGDTHTQLERLWKRYEATTDKVTRAEIEQEMRARYSKFADDYRGEAASVKDFDAYSGVRKPVDSPTHNSDRLGDNGTTYSGGRGWPSREGAGDSGAHQSGGYHGDRGRSVASFGPELQTTAPAPTATPTPTSATFHVPTQPTLPPVIGGRTGLPIHGSPQPAPRPGPSGLVNPVNHGARPTPALPPTRPTTVTPQPIQSWRGKVSPTSATPPTRQSANPRPTTGSRQPAKPATPRFRREGGIRASIQGPQAKPGTTRTPVRASGEPEATLSADGERTTEWTVDRATVAPVIRGHRGHGGHEHDPGTVAARDGMRQRKPRVYFEHNEDE
ncbi:hypothetical protein [Stackebrandtia nassauensis]|uniref:PPE family domain-containing protein n=1 Tax=Stackebrandtia nassauensis (strain DSM 44728 / CIP 108903 / NRRL B-16338 / NBRC 102104 / LLR-40K-21) TaxID=446470 RepID=D3Q192_STANL|nr:hypothetical protein [Stackebrandtia nassauensis]ADD45672.1 hypothetical protein Snas_6048 [Stackebrandtia nassauensis DSM 44728]